MSARGFLASMRARGVYFFSMGGRLRWYAPSQLSPGDLAQAGGLKAELLALVADPELEAQAAGADPEEAAYLREERAGILEHDAGLNRSEAELRARIPIHLEKSA